MARTLKPDDRISRYRIVAPLGAGGMGEVYRAHDETLNRDVALKILPPSLVRNEERLRRFVLEAKSASSLNHPNIVTIYEIGHDRIRRGEGASDADSALIHFISMELITGDTLATKIHLEKAELRTLLGWLAQAAEGLAKAHGAGIVHRDLKPGNIMISQDGFAKVLDFGLAKLTETQVPEAERTSAPTETAERTGEGVVVGTTGYMSPEQVQGKPVDARSDVFSFGCILYEAATRRRPFAAETGVETMHKILKETPAPIEDLNPEAPAELRRLIRRCLAKDPNRRHDSMKALAIELQEIAEEYDALSASGSSGSGLAAAVPTRRRLGIAPTAAVVVIAVAATLSGVWVLRRDAGKKASAALQSMKLTTVTSRGDVESAVISPDGRYLAYTDGPIGPNSVWVRQVATGSDVQVFHGAVHVVVVSFSPDGEHLFYTSKDPEAPTQRALYEIPAFGGTPIKRASNLGSKISFAPDGHRICFRRGLPEGQRPELIILDLKSGQERILTTVEAPAIMFSSPAWSPDGERIAAGEYATARVGTHLVTFRASDGRREVTGSETLRNLGDWLDWLPDGSGLLSVSPDITNRGQVLLLPFPRGEPRRITNDASFYFGVSLSADGSTLATVRRLQVLNLWTAEAHAGGAIRQLTSATGTENTVLDYSPGQDGSILFLSRGATQTLWRIGDTGSGPVPFMTEGIIGNRFFSLPDGGGLYVQVGEDGVGHLWRADADGSHARQLTAESGERPLTVSPDGRTLLFGRMEALREIWAVDTGGGKPSRIVSDRKSPTGGSGSALLYYSRDGRRIAYLDLQEVEDKRRSVYKVIAAAGGEPLETVSLPDGARDVKWAWDGSSLTFLDLLDGVANVFRQRLGGGKPEPITRFTETEVRLHEWGPDGRRLLLVRGDGQIENVWTVEADGSHAVRLTDFRSGRISRADWLPPDGRRVVFLYGQQSQDIVLIKNFR